MDHPDPRTRHAGRKEREIHRVQEYGARSEAVKAAIKLLDELATERDLVPDVSEAARASIRTVCNI